MSRLIFWLRRELLMFAVFSLMLGVHAFNFMPRASSVIRAPQDQKLNLPQYRSSYFGYTLVMRETRWVCVFTSAFTSAPCKYLHAHNCHTKNKRCLTAGYNRNTLTYSWAHLHLCQQFAAVTQFAALPPPQNWAIKEVCFKYVYRNLFESISALWTAPFHTLTPSKRTPP